MTIKIYKNNDLPKLGEASVEWYVKGQLPSLQGWWFS